MEIHMVIFFVSISREMMIYEISYTLHVYKNMVEKRYTLQVDTRCDILVLVSRLIEVNELLYFLHPELAGRGCLFKLLER